MLAAWSKESVLRDVSGAVAWTGVYRMVDQTLIQAKVAYGLGKAATKLGSTFTVYRPTVASNPLHQSPLRTTLANFDSSPKFPFSAPSKLSAGTVYGLFNTTDVRPGDIYVGTKTYFVAAWEPMSPALCELCNLTFSIFDVDGVAPLPAGDVGYSGRQTSTDVAVASGWPCFGMMRNKGDFSTAKLPGDVRAGAFEIVIPPIPGIMMQIGYRMVDGDGVAYMVGGVEPLAYGCWKVTAAVATT